MKWLTATRRTRRVGLGTALFALTVQASAALPTDQTGQLPRAIAASELVPAIGRLSEEQADLERQQEQVHSRAEQLRTQGIVRGRAYVRFAKAGLLPVAGGFAGLVDHAVRLERLRRAILRGLQEEQQLARTRQGLAQKLAALRERSDTLREESARFERSNQAIAAAEEREDAFQRAFSSSYNPGSHTAIYGATAGAALPFEGNTFAAYKGRLPFPLAGRAEVRRVARSARRGPGLEMVTHPGAAVRAIYPGRVAFMDAYADYGLTVIVDHGDHHYTLSAGLADVAVQVGAEVAFGDRLGNVAAGSQEAVLYFELRVQGEPIEATEWFGL